VRAEDVLQRRIPPLYFLGLVILALTAAGYWLQSQVHLNHDVSYFAHFSRWLLQGRSLGSDLHDGNLPMVWVLFTPVAGLVQAGFTDEATAVRGVFSVYFLISVVLLVVVLSSLDEAKRPTAIGWIAAFLLVATLGPGFSFGQREHASVLFAMPYLAAAALRLDGLRISSNWLASGIGVLAGVGFALKPHFIIVPALIELWLLLRLGWRELLGRVESLAMGATIAVYAVLAFLIIGEYLKFTIGMTMSAYWAYGTAGIPLLIDRFIPVVQPAIYGFAIALVTRSWSRQHTVVMLAGLGYSTLYFLQSKGFVYHAFPVLVCSVTFLGICVGTGLAKVWVRWQRDRTRRHLVLALSAVLLALPPIKRFHDDVVRWYATYNIAWGPTGQFRQAVIDVVDHFAPESGSYFFAFTTHPFPGFPTASYTTAEYSGRSIVQSFIPAYSRLDEVTDPAIRAGVLRAADYQRRVVVEDFERRPPSIVFAEGTRARLGMNGRPFDDIAFYREDPRFREIWSSYDEYPSMGPLRVFVLRGADPNRRLSPRPN
jgi:hypothetical protein